MDDLQIDIKKGPIWLRAAIAVPLTAIACGLVWFLCWMVWGELLAIHADLATHMTNRQKDAAAMRAAVYQMCLSIQGPKASQLELERCRVILVAKTE